MDAFEKELARLALHFAAQDGNLAQVRELVGAGHALDTFDEVGNTPLTLAAQAEHFEVVRFLLGMGANPNAHDPALIGNTPLREIAATCSLEMAQLLIQAGADPTIPGWMQLTALDKAAQRQDIAGRKIHALLLSVVPRSA